jgi:N-acetylglucosaminyldiphosphoundecaprenol N-acetyl-beta-D-mannosaminyltransferase
MASIAILGARVDAVGRAEAVPRIAELARGTQPSLVVTIGTEMVMEARRNPRYRAVLDKASLALCDTVGLLAISKLRGGPLSERVTGVALVADLAAASVTDPELRLYFIGGKGDTAQRAADALRTQFPGARIVGVRDGYFSDADAASIAAEIALTQATVVLAGLGFPKQELWLDATLPASGARVGVGIGGSLDVYAGNVERAPALAQRLGVEWLYRLIREPRRWRRQLALPRFAALALAEAAKGRTKNA